MFPNTNFIGFNKKINILTQYNDKVILLFYQSMIIDSTAHDNSIHMTKLCYYIISI